MGLEINPTELFTKGKDLISGFGTGDNTASQTIKTAFKKLFEEGKLVQGHAPTNNTGSLYGYGYAGNSNAGASTNL